MAITVEVETAPESGVWNDYSSLALLPSLQIQSSGRSDVGTMSVSLRDAAGTAVVLPEAGIRSKDGAVTIFRGKIKKRGKTDPGGPAAARVKTYDISAQDMTCVLADDVIEAGVIRPAGESDADRLIWLVTTYGTKGVTAAAPGSGGFVQTIYGSTLPEQDFSGLSLYAAINEVLKFGGGEVYVDFNLALHHFATETDAAPFNLSDTPNGTTTFGYADFSAPDDSVDLVNAVYVIGAGDVGEWVPDPATWPTASQSTYGRKEASIKDTTLEDSASRQAAGNAYLAKYSQPRGPITCKVFKDGLRAGMTIQITNSVWGITAVSYKIASVAFGMLGTTKQFAYTVTMQDAPVTLQGYIGEGNRQGGQDVRRGTNAAIDYAAQFLIGRVKVVAVLPTLPDPNYAQGSMVMLTSDGKVYRTTDGLGWTTAADAADITVNQIQAGQIAAGAIGAEALAAQIILADKLFTTDIAPNQRVEIDDAGVRAYDATNKRVVNIPSQGTDPVSVIGKIETGDFISTASAELRGTNTLAGSSTTTVQVGITDPVSAPTVTVDTPVDAILASAPAQPGLGLCYDPAGSAGGATPTYWVGGNPTTGNLLDLAYEYRRSDGALLRTLRKTGTTQTLTATAGYTGHAANRANGYTGSLDSQIATPITLPSNRGTMTITKVACYLAGRLGAVSVKNAVWDTSGNRKTESSAYSAASGGATTVGASALYDKAVTRYAVGAGGTIWAGYLRTGTGDGSQNDVQTGSYTTKKGSGNDGNMTSISTVTTERPNVYVTYEYTADSSVEGSIGQIVGVARVGSYIFVLDSAGILLQYNQADLTYVGQTNLSSYMGGNKANAGLFYDGTNLVIVTATGVSGTDQVRLVKASASTRAYVSTVNCTGFAFNGSTGTTRGGFWDGGNYNILINGYARIYSAAGAWAGGVWDYGVSAEMAGGLHVLSTQPVAWGGGSNRNIYGYTGWDGSASSDETFYVGYSWYDNDAGGTGLHETRRGPLWSGVIGRRRRVTIVTPAIPGASTEPPTRVRVYMLAGSSPAYGSAKLQVEDAGTSRTLTTYNTSGAADPSSNNFPLANPAEIKSAVTGWSLKGDGSAYFKARGFIRTGVTVAVTTVSQDLPFATVVQDSDPGQYNATNKTWTVPTGGAGLYLIAWEITGAVTLGTVTIIRGGMKISGTQYTGWAPILYGGSYVSEGYSTFAVLADGDTLSFASGAVTGGGTYTMGLNRFAAIRLAGLSFA